MLFGQKFLQCHGVWLLRQGLPIEMRHFNDARPSLRGTHNAPEGGATVGHQKLGDALIGCDHELFNQLPCAVVRLRAQFGDAVAFEFSTGLKGLKIERTRLVASFFEQLREVVLCSELCIHALHAQSGLGPDRRRTAEFLPLC